MEKIITCPKCNSPHGYQLGYLFICPECGHEWSPKQTTESITDETSTEVLDAHGNILNDGDDVIVIKDLPVKGAPKPLKAGTKVKNIRLQDGDHNIDCKIKEFGALALKSEFVKKA